MNIVLHCTQSQLRNRLARELQNTMEGKESDRTLSTPPSRGQSSMMTQVTNNMVAEYLQKGGYEFTLSIFLPEAGVNMGKVGQSILHNLIPRPQALRLTFKKASANCSTIISLWCYGRKGGREGGREEGSSPCDSGASQTYLWKWVWLARLSMCMQTAIANVWCFGGEEGSVG